MRSYLWAKIIPDSYVKDGRDVIGGKKLRGVLV